VKCFVVSLRLPRTLQIISICSVLCEREDAVRLRRAYNNSDHLATENNKFARF
jgi:hypothetical protein